MSSDHHHDAKVDLEVGRSDIEFTPFTRAVRRLENVPVMQMDAKSDQATPIQSTPALSIKPKMWRMCGTEVDPRPILFFTQLAISAVIIAFCVRQLVYVEGSDSRATYGSILMFIVGIYLPTPMR